MTNVYKDDIKKKFIFIRSFQLTVSKAHFPPIHKLKFNSDFPILSRVELFSSIQKVPNFLTFYLYKFYSKFNISFSLKLI